jgi:hypothetical protein
MMIIKKFMKNYLLVIKYLEKVPLSTLAPKIKLFLKE